MRDSPIGDRWKELFERADRLIEEHDRTLTDSDRSFLDDIRERLASYRERTWLSAAQLNRLTRTADKYVKPW